MNSSSKPKFLADDAIQTCVAPLFVPGNRPDLFEKAANSGADTIVIDLEDAVAPSDKEAARQALDAAPTKVPVIVRVNALHTPWHNADVERVFELAPSAIMVPKSNCIEGLDQISRVLDHKIPIIALVETSEGLRNLDGIASHNDVVRIAFGSVDFCADVGCAHTPIALLHARSRIVLASRIAKIAAPIDGVTTSFRSTTKTMDDAQHALEIGFSGKLCIHPSQVETVREVFTHGDEAIAWAQRVLASGEASVSIDGEMIDKPVRIRAAMILKAAGLES